VNDPGPTQEDSIAEIITFQVGNLAYGVTEADLRALFAPAGEVISVRLVTDRRGRPKGLASVKIRVDEADAVLEKLRGTQVKGRTVDLWRAMPDTQRGGGSRKPGKRRR
jgi:RNA recognition motif-containing protein